MQQKSHVGVYIKDGYKISLEVGDFEPHQGDYLIEEGNISRIEFITHKITPNGAVLFVETEDAPGLVREFKKGMKIGRPL